MFFKRFYTIALLLGVAGTCSLLGMDKQQFLSAFFKCAQEEFTGSFVSRQRFQVAEDRQKALRIIDLIMRSDIDGIKNMSIDELRVDKSHDMALYMDAHDVDPTVPAEFVGLYVGGASALALAVMYAESIDPRNTIQYANIVAVIKALLEKGLDAKGAMGIAYFYRDEAGRVLDYLSLCSCPEQYISSPDIVQLFVQHGLVLKHHLHR